MKSLSDDVESLCLVKERRELESTYGTSFTGDLLVGPSHHVIKENIREIDRTALEHLQPLPVILTEVKAGVRFGSSSRIETYHRPSKPIHIDGSSRSWFQSLPAL